MTFKGIMKSKNIPLPEAQGEAKVRNKLTTRYPSIKNILTSSNKIGEGCSECTNSENLSSFKDNKNENN